MTRREAIGDCVLIHADCFDALPELAGAELDMLLTDMPYGCTDCDWDVPVDLEAYWPMSKAATKHNAAHCHFCQMPFAGRLWQSNQKDFRYDLIYQKRFVSGYLSANIKPLRKHEFVFLFYQKQPTYNPQKTPGKPYKRTGIQPGNCYRKKTVFDSFNTTGERHPTSLIPVGMDKATNTKGTHNTQKDADVVAWLIRTYSNTGETILDPFMGSGTTGIAAIRTGRKFIGIEKDGHWFDVACRRIEAAYQEKGLLNYLEVRT